MAGGFTDEGIEAIERTATHHVGVASVPGLAVLVAHGDDVHAFARGVLEIGGAEVRRDSLFRIASTSKPLTAAVVLRLVDDGLVDLDEPVDRLLPELASPRVLTAMSGPLDDTVPARRAITVRDLCTFTFGFGMCWAMVESTDPWPIVTAATELELSTFGPPAPQVPPDPDTWIARLGSLPLLAHPGETWLYNTGASVLGVLASRAAGAPFFEVLRTRLLEPLSMHDTSMWTASPERLAAAYRSTSFGLELVDAPDGAWHTPPAFEDGAGGLVSCVDDLYRFAQMLLAHGAPVLSRPLVDEMTRDQLVGAQRGPGTEVFLGQRGWGLCQAVETHGPRAGAFGWDGGLGTSWLVDPVRDLVVIVLTQLLFESPALPPVHRDVQDAAYAAIA